MRKGERGWSDPMKNFADDSLCVRIATVIAMYVVYVYKKRDDTNGNRYVCAYRHRFVRSTHIFGLFTMNIPYRTRNLNTYTKSYACSKRICDRVIHLVLNCSRIVFIYYLYTRFYNSTHSKRIFMYAD